MLEQFPFWERAALLAGLMLIGAVVDLCRHGHAATRHKEYAFIWFTGLIGGLMGGANDLLTSSISPAYFVTGKGLAEGDGFGLRVAMFGLKEGLSAGVIAGAVCVYVSRRKSQYAPLRFGQLAGLLWMPAGGALAGAMLLPLAVSGSDPTHLALRLDGIVPSEQIGPLLRVWWIHTGLYGGLLAGLIGLLVVVLRRRRAGGKMAGAD